VVEAEKVHEVLERAEAIAAKEVRVLKELRRAKAQPKFITSQKFCKGVGSYGQRFFSNG
jgi:regulator of RNase E activity RraA